MDLQEGEGSGELELGTEEEWAKRRKREKGEKERRREGVLETRRRFAGRRRWPMVADTGEKGLRGFWGSAGL